MERNCIRCNEPIHECMGSVLVRDWIDAEQGKIPWSQVLEHCGKCTMLMIDFWTPEQTKNYLNSL